MMPDTSIATNLDEPLDIKVNLFSKLTLNLILMVNNLSETLNLVFSKVTRLSVRIDASLT